MNRKLEAGEPLTDPEAEEMGLEEDWMEELQQDLLNAAGKQSLAQPVTLYRGLRTDEQYSPGQRLRRKSWTSTSTKGSTSLKFTKDPGEEGLREGRSTGEGWPTLFEIEAPAGTHALNTRDTDLHEIILPPGLETEVVGVENRADGTRLVRMKIVDPSEPPGDQPIEETYGKDATPVLPNMPEPEPDSSLPAGVAEIVDATPDLGTFEDSHRVEARDENGNVMGSLEYVYDPYRGTAEISYVNVNENYRRRGIATALMDKAREKEPALQHSRNMTDDGRSFASSDPTLGREQENERIAARMRELREISNRYLNGDEATDSPTPDVASVADQRTPPDPRADNPEFADAVQRVQRWEDSKDLERQGIQDERTYYVRDPESGQMYHDFHASSDDLNAGHRLEAKYGRTGEWERAYRANQRDQVHDDFWEAYGSDRGTREEHDRRLDNHVREAFADAPVAVRVTRGMLSKILEDGRFRTFHETGRGKGLSGAKGYDTRTKHERMMFGYGDDTDPSSRPVYGYVAVGGLHPSGVGSGELGAPSTDRLAQYGNVIVKLKDSVKTRTTAMIGDSLDNKISGRPTPVLQPTRESYTPYVDTRPDDIDGSDFRGISKGGFNAAGLTGDRGLDHYEQPAFRRNAYAEAQIHAPENGQPAITTDDIDEILFPGSVPKKMMDALDAKGIRYRRYDHKAIQLEGTEEEKTMSRRISAEDRAEIKAALAHAEQKYEQTGDSDYLKDVKTLKRALAGLAPEDA
jgi:GNAT superfamily N-acetyltransferase